MQYFIFVYLIVVLAFVIYSAAGIYHLWRFGYSGDLSKVAIIIYSLVSLGIIFGTLSLVAIKYLVS